MASKALKQVALTVNGVLKPVGVKLQSQEAVRRLEAQARQSQGRPGAAVFAVKDLIACVTEFLFPDLSSLENRAELMLKLEGTGCMEALYIAEYLRRSCKDIGDVCEFGVAQGATSAFMANEIRHIDKDLWLFDSFQGLPRPTEKDSLISDDLGLGSIEAYEGQMAFPPEDVRVRLESVSFPPQRAKVVAGFIEDTIHQSHLPSQVCFAYVDFDFYQPISIALDFLANRLSPNGHIIVDDYGNLSSGAQTAVDEFVSSHAESFEMTFPLCWSRTGKRVDKFAIIKRRG